MKNTIDLLLTYLNACLLGEIIQCELVRPYVEGNEGVSIEIKVRENKYIKSDGWFAFHPEMREDIENWLIIYGCNSKPSWNNTGDTFYLKFY